MRVRKGGMALALSAVLGLLLVLGGCQGVREVKVAVGEVVLAPGETGTVEVFVINPPEVKTIQVGPVGALTFDPAVIRVTAVEGVNGFQVLAAAIDNLSGRVQFATGFPGGALGPVGPRVKLAVIALEVQAVGASGSSSTLAITAVDVFADRHGREIPLAEIIPGAAEVR